MLKRHTILCACGSSIATSTFVAAKIKDLCKENKIDANVQTTKFCDLDAQAAALKPSLILVSTDIKRDLGVPVLVAIPYLTGVGKADLSKKVLEILKKADAE